MSRAAILQRISEAVVEQRQPKPSPAEKARDTEEAAKNGSDLHQEFLTNATENSIHVATCSNSAAIPSESKRVIADLAFEGRSIRIAPHPALQALDWTANISTPVGFGGWMSGDTIAVSHAVGAIADSGSVVIASGPTSPTGLAFLPDLHIVIVHRDTVSANLKDAMEKMKRLSGPDHQPMPRAINIISGASRTADIGGKIVHGAHGPLKLAVITYAGA